MCGARRDPESKLVVPVTMGETPPPSNRGSPIQVRTVVIRGVGVTWELSPGCGAAVQTLLLNMGRGCR